MPGHTSKLRGAAAVLLLATLTGVPGCGSGSDDAAATQAAAAAKAARAAYDKQILAWRADRLQRLMLPDGWLSLVGMHWLEVGTTRIGHGTDNGTRLAVGPDHLGVLKLGADGSLLFTADPGAEATVDGAPAIGPTRLVSDADPVANPSVVGFNKGDASFIVIKRGERHALRVRDALAPTRMAFPGIPSFDIDPAFRFNATFQPHPAGQKIEIINVLGMVEPMDNPGTVTFSKDGKSHTLEAIDEGDHRLFLIYADRTSGHQSYAAARYLYSMYPDASGHTIVDFNEGYNPPCAFTDFATCPLPPLSNRLDLAITAGEMKPGKHAAASP
ncbi:DUF1684 domain-containing protein [soil metagenome]